MGYQTYTEPREFKVATICGSMRFYDRMVKVAEIYTAAEAVVLMPFVAVDPEAQASDHKAMLDRMHRQKIDMADLVIIVTDPETQYVGDSTRAEIEYAESKGIPVVWQMERAA
jgi:nucleoside 2-deoxyribosyltransferase